MKKNLATLVLAALLAVVLVRDAVVALAVSRVQVDLLPLPTAEIAQPYVSRMESYTKDGLQSVTEVYRNDKGDVVFRELDGKGKALASRAATEQEVDTFTFGEGLSVKDATTDRVKALSTWLSSTSKDWSRLTAVQKDTALKVLVDGMADLATVVEGR